jgi:NAD(P)-dependent dehydrogenase (short-subunit alcohol dehydrogenase family)
MSNSKKVWLITGCSRGLGKDMANAVLAAGHKLVATARNADTLSHLAARYPDTVRIVDLDVTDAEAAREAVATAVENFGGLDVLVNNAGFGHLSSIEDMTEEYFRAQFETNFFGLLHVTRAALPVMRKQRSGHIIQVSSIGGRIGTPGLGAYQASKWAVGGMSEVLAREVKHLGIKVTVLEPGGMATEFASKSATFGDIGDDYQASVGMMVNMMSQMGEDLMVGDPAKVAQMVMKVADMDEPPLHLLAGSDAFFVGQAQTAYLAAHDEKNRELSLSTDFDGAPDVKETYSKLVELLWV